MEPDGATARLTICGRLSALHNRAHAVRAPADTASADTELITAVGLLVRAQIGESLRLRGRWSSHLKCRRQFEVASCTTVPPATEQGIRRYLGSGLVKGIGPVMAERMAGRFGAGIMRIIDDEPGRLAGVPGLGPKRSARIKDAWAEPKAVKEVMIFLQGVGVSTSLR